MKAVVAAAELVMFVYCQIDFRLAELDWSSDLESLGLGGQISLQR